MSRKRYYFRMFEDLEGLNEFIKYHNGQQYKTYGI